MQSGVVLWVWGEGQGVGGWGEEGGQNNAILPTPHGMYVCMNTQQYQAVHMFIYNNTSLMSLSTGAGKQKTTASIMQRLKVPLHHKVFIRIMINNGVYNQLSEKMSKLSNYAVCWNRKTISMCFCSTLRTNKICYCWTLRTSSTCFCWTSETNKNICY